MLNMFFVHVFFTDTYMLLLIHAWIFLAFSGSWGHGLLGYYLGGSTPT